MTPELLAAWKQHVKACEEGYYLPAICTTVIAVDAELDALRAQVARLVETLQRLVHGVVNGQSLQYYPGMCEAALAVLKDPTAQSAREWLEARIAEAVQAEQERFEQKEHGTRDLIAELARKDERESCAKVCEYFMGEISDDAYKRCAAAIREGR